MKKKKLNIGIMVDQLVPGGVQKSAIHEVRELKKLGVSVTLFVLVRQSFQYQYEDLTQGIKVIFLSDFNPWPFRKALRIPYFSFLTHLHLLNPFFVNRYKVLKNLDFIVSHGTTTCITAASLTRNLKIPYMAFVYDPMIFILKKVYGKTPIRYLFPIMRPLTRYYERSYLTSASLIATSSKVHQKFLKKEYFVNPLIINLGVETLDKLAKMSTQKPILLGYSRWQEAKNPELFLWLAKKIPRASIIVAGFWTNPQEEAKFRQKIKRAKLGKRVKLISPISETDLKKIAAQSLVWIHPNFEAFGMGGLEMAALGLPIIIPKGSGVTELFVDGQHGFFPEIGNKEELLQLVGFLIKHPATAKKMGEAAAKLAQKLTWRRHTQRVLYEVENYLNQGKFVFLTNAFVATHSTGGGDQVVIELARRTPKNIYLTIVVPFAGLYHWKRAKVRKPNIRFIVLRQNPFDNIDRPIHLFLAYMIRAVQTHFLLKSLPPFQILHTATDLLPDVVPAYLSKRRFRERWVARFFHFIEHPLKREGRLWVNIGSFGLQQLSLAFLASADTVMTDNPTLRKGLVAKGISTEKIKLHLGGVDRENIKKIRPSKKYASSALVMGRLQHHKGVFDAVDVWKKVVIEKPKAKLTLVGYGPPQITQKLREKIKNTRLEKNIRLTGYLKKREKALSYLRATKLLLFLDHEAGFGLVVAEAMTAGVPVVSYKLPIFGSVYKKGYLAAPLKNTNLVARIVLTLLENKAKYQKLARLAKTESKKFDWNYRSRLFFRELSLKMHK